MHIRQTLIRALALALTLLLVLGSANPALAVQEAGMTVTKIDNDALDARLEQPIVAEPEEEAPYGDTDMVRVSILLEKKSTLEAGFSTTGITQNDAAMAYRETLRADQETVTAQISQALGEKLEVHWNMTLAANIISAGLQYGQIETVKAVPGVKDVILETCYSPAVVDRQEVADPNMATSSAQIGSPTAYAAGYTGEGMRIAVIDTGIDVTHQSFKANAFRYSLQRNAENAGVDYDTYAAQLDLLDEEEIQGVLDQLNLANFEASSLYVNEKIPFGFNYVDRNVNLSHILDASSEHGSHVAGISAANAYIPRKDGSFAHALEECHVQGVAPDAQLIVMKVFGVAGGAYDSDYLAAIEDAIVLGCDAINLSLGSANPGNSRYAGADIYREILDSLTECDAVVSISAGNSGSWAEKTDSGALYADGVSMATAGSPGTYTNALTVASVDNSGFTGHYLTFGDRAVSYSDTASQSYANEPMTSISGEFPYVFLDGYGTAKDFAALGAAISAGSYILMGPDANRSYADGKIKAELGDDPERTGTYDFSFTLYNLTEEEQTYDLSVDLFTQDVYHEDQASYMDAITTPLLTSALWTVDGKPLHPGQGQPDFDGNGLVDRSDGQALLDYVTGARGTICNEGQADRNGDGLVTTYDVYLFLKGLDSGEIAPQSAETEEQSNTVTLQPGASSQIHVKLSLEPEQKIYLDRNYPAGAYIQGYAFAKAVTTEEGVQGVTHSIPILGYYGSWTEPSMYDVGTYQDFRFGLESRNPYLGSLNGTEGNMITVRYAGDTETHPFGGNPVLTDASYLPQRNALNNQSGDRLSRICFTAIRNAADARVVVADAATGEVYEAQDLGEIYGAYYHTNAGAWQNTGNRLNLDWAGTGKNHTKLPEGTTVNVSLVLAPEYYVGVDGATDWEALEDGAYFTTQVTIDNTDPEILQAAYSDGQLTVEARDNRYLAAIAVYDAAGTLLDRYVPNQTVEAQTQTATFNLGTLAEPRILIQAYDYAMNLATYRVTIGQPGGEKTESITLNPTELELTKGNSRTIQATVEPWVTDVLQWTTSDSGVAVVNSKGVVTAVEKGQCVITATSTLSPEVSATCEVTVSTVNSTVYGALQDKEGNPMLYSWNLACEDTWTPGLALDTSLTSLAYDSANREFYLVDGEANAWAMHRVSLDTGKTLATAENPTGVPLWDMEYSQIFSTASSPKIAAVVSYLFLTPQDPMAISQRAFDMSSYLKKYTGADRFVAVTSLGETDYEDQNGVTHQAELFLAMDNAGVPWEIDVYASGEGYSAGLGYFEPALPNLDFPGDGENHMYCSMTVTTENDTPVLYLSYFNGVTNELYRMPYADGAFSAELVGDVGEGVWPAAVYSVVPNGSGAGNARLEPVETFQVEDAVLTPENMQDSLHAAQAELSGIRDGQQTEASLEVEITADEALTNGLYELAYDPEQLSYDGLNATLELTSVNRTAGKLVFGFADGNGVAQDEVLATVRFRPRDAYTCEYGMTLTSREMNDTMPETREQIQVGSHSWDGGVVTKAPTYQADGERVYTCTICGAEQAEAIDRLVLDRDCHGGRGCPSQTFTDVSGTAWYHSAVDYMVAYGLMRGTSSTTFCPQQATTRAMMATILYRMEGSPAVGSGSAFRDVPAGRWYSDAITWAHTKGIVVGYGDGTFGPHDTLTREQMAVLLYRYAGYQMADTIDRAPLDSFPDSSKVSDWAYEAMSWAVAQGILTGSANGTVIMLNPTGSATRAELATVLMRYQER